MAVVLSVILLGLLTLLTALFIISPGKLKPFKDQKGQVLAACSSFRHSFGDNTATTTAPSV